MQACDGRRDEGTGDTLAVQRYACAVKQVVQPVVRPPEPSVRRPYVGCQPVVKRIGVADAAADPLADPSFAGEPVVVAVAVNRAPAVEALLRADADQTAGALRTAASVEPLGETVLKLVVPHFVGEERKIVLCQASFRHFPYPNVPHGAVPRPPVLLEHRSTGLYFERDADPIDVENIGVRGQRPVHVVERIAVLDFVIHMEHSDSALQSVLPDVVDAEVEQHTAVLAAGKGDVDIVEKVENRFQPLLCPLINIHGYRFLLYSIVTYCVHSFIGTNPSERNISAWRISVMERIV